MCLRLRNSPAKRNKEATGFLSVMSYSQLDRSGWKNLIKLIWSGNKTFKKQPRRHRQRADLTSEQVSICLWPHDIPHALSDSWLICTNWPHATVAAVWNLPRKETRLARCKGPVLFFSWLFFRMSVLSCTDGNFKFMGWSKTCLSWSVLFVCGDRGRVSSRGGQKHWWT